MKGMREFVDEFAKLLPVGTSVSLTEAERRAGEFLVAQATIANWKHDFASEQSRLQSTLIATYAQEMSKGTAKTMTENKMFAESSDEHIKAREELEGIESDISYLRAYADIFSQAHVFYRNMAKDSM